MGVTRYVNLSFIAAGLLAWIVFGGFAQWVLELFGASVNKPLIGVNFRISDLVGLAIGAMTALYLKRKYNSWATEVANELSKVTWPSWNETRVSTVVVIVTTIIIALILGGFDYVWAQLTSLIYDL